MKGPFLSVTGPATGRADLAHMPASLVEYCECFEQIEDDVVNFLPLVANIEVFGWKLN